MRIFTGYLCPICGNQDLDMYIVYVIRSSRIVECSKCFAVGLVTKTPFLEFEWHLTYQRIDEVIERGLS